MSRQVIKTAQGPFEVKSRSEPVWVCMCGLSKNQPFCDGSHRKTLDEEADTTYVYHEDGAREKVAK